jgi:hypothetical protein
MLLSAEPGAGMPSSHLPNTLGGLDHEIDQRDWIGQFPVESESECDYSLRRRSETLFTVVRYGRPLPIVLPPPSPEPETLPPSSRHRYSLSKRVKRAVSPILTVLFIAYVTVVFVTAWIGVRRGEAARRGESAPQVSAGGFEPANRP